MRNVLNHTLVILQEINVVVIRVMFYSGASWYSNVLSWDEVLIVILMLGLDGDALSWV